MRTADWLKEFARVVQVSHHSNLTGSHAWESVCYEARPLLLAALYLHKPRKTIIVTPSYDKALQWQAKLSLSGVPTHVMHQLPSGSSSLFEDSNPEHTALSDRLGSLRALCNPEPCIIITSPQAVLERTIPKDVLLESFIEVQVNTEIDPEKFIESLYNLGYEQAEPVRIPGQYSRRGGIIDVYPSGFDNPLRIELFGDEVESIRTFDFNSQRSTGHITGFSLAPSRETVYHGDAVHIAEMLEETLSREAGQLDEGNEIRLNELIGSDIEALKQRLFFDRLDLYRPLLHSDSGCALDLLSDGDLLVLDEPLELEVIANRTEDELSQALKARGSRGEILFSTANDFLLPAEHLGVFENKLILSAMNSFPEWLKINQTEDWGTSSLSPYRHRQDALAETLKTWKKQGVRITFTTDQPNRAKAVLAGIESFPYEEVKEAGDILAQGNLGGGFMMASRRIAVVTDAELFGVARLRLPQKRFNEGSPVATVLDLKPGDFVVHISFGIGIFRGLVNRSIEGVDKEFLYLEYAVPDKLFVPTDQLDRIQKYLNPGDDSPKLNRLTGGEWQRTLGKAKEDAKAFARDLVKLYAQRKRVQRRSYAEDTPFQIEMEQTFPWVETPSQITAIKEVKADMEAGYPMDRLICGDVGFGKTEIAIRGAFKAVQSGRQVAILCPTTILSEQHYRNFNERLGPFGTKLEIVNRFRSAAEKKEVFSGLKDGSVEIVIGTHALLGVGIKFKDLGMVIIDEEQKFGVKQKEMLKHLRTEVDVLTLSATPIPRTLSMALMDIRQMSLINDPPPGRLPIRTFIKPYGTEVIREALLRELARGGQAFYVYNRVESIYHVEEKLRKIVPTARIGVAHGQMHEREIEPIMLGFVKGEIDILLSTTIIENGIDIPNANTLIVENADKLGLSQLYQLRGRVGRSDRQAYSIFLYHGKPEMSVNASGTRVRERLRATTLTENATSRLSAIQEFSTLGSGYSLAFRDLQIRGAGELLGAKQHGTMANVGFELYTQLINEAVAQLKHSVDGDSEAAGNIKDPLESLDPLPTFELPVVAMIPVSFISDQAQRLYFYQRMMSVRDLDALGEVRKELEDRYGKPPEELSRAFHVLNLRILAKELSIHKVVCKDGRIVASFTSGATHSPRVFTLLARLNAEAYFTRDQYIWPYRGDALNAVDTVLTKFKATTDELDRQRAMLGV